jgi:hypothetical protein
MRKRVDFGDSVARQQAAAEQGASKLAHSNRAFGMRMRGHVWGKNNVWFWSYGAFDTGCCCPHPDPFWRQ